MEKQKVRIWVGDHNPHEAEVTDRWSLVREIAAALRERSSEMGEIVGRWDTVWAGYRRITIHISPSLCQRDDCGDVLGPGETTECAWHTEEEE